MFNRVSNKDRVRWMQNDIIELRTMLAAATSEYRRDSLDEWKQINRLIEWNVSQDVHIKRLEQVLEEAGIIIPMNTNKPDYVGTNKLYKVKKAGSK